MASCKVFQYCTNLPSTTGPTDLVAEIRYDGSLIDPYFIEASILVKDEFGLNQYTQEEGFENLVPVRDSLGVYYLEINYGNLTQIPGDYKVLWTIQALASTNPTGYEQGFSVVG